MVLKLNRTGSRLQARSATMADQVVLKLVTFHGLLYLRSATLADQVVLKRIRSPS